MKLNTFAPKKSRAQAMVEFAIVLPLLLLLLYGLLEAGRLLFMYSTIVTATRQAARYGSATGQGVDYTGIGGPDNSSYPRYRDCYGIRQAAQRVDFLNSFDDVDITIQYDSGPGTVIDDTCNGDADPNVTPNTDNSSRILVTIEGDFNPIVPRIVPFIARTVANGNPIRAISARTIIVAVTIEVTPIGGGPPPGPGTSQLALAMTASPTTYAFVGDPISFTYTLTNNGAVELIGITLTPTHGTAICPATILAAGASMTCTGSYNITTDDVLNGSVVAQATATASDGSQPVTSNTGTVTLTFTVLPQLALSKSTSVEYATTGGSIGYTFTLTNTGNVPLTGATVSDPQLGGTIVGCSGDLAIGASITCTANYVLTSNDIGNDTFVNTATATATYGAQPVTSNTASASVYTGPLYLRATVSPASVNAPTTVTYTYELINNTGITLYPPYTISGQRGSETCSALTGSIGVGGSITCNGTFTVTQSDLDTNASLNNTIQVVACNDANNCNGASKKVPSYRDTVTLTLVRTPGLAMEFTAGPNPATTLGTVITYTYTISNTGNVTLSPSITDTKITGITCPASFAPATTQNCTAIYTVTQADLDAGSITNTATATAIFNAQTVSSASQSFTVLTYLGPRLRMQIYPNPASFTGVGQFIVYSYTFTNTGSVPLIGPYLVSDSKVTFVDCGSASSQLAMGASTTCVGSYATTQADMDAGNIINSANATASDGTQTITSNSAMAVVYAPGAPTLTPTLGPTATSTPTSTPTIPPTAVTSCGTITTSAITTPTDTMTMTITNPNAYAVTVSNVVVRWNRTGGSGNSILSLQRATLGGTQFWNGPSNNTGGPLTLTPSATLSIPGNNASTTITFTFDRNYQTESGESIIINLSTPGCESTPIHRP